MRARNLRVAAACLALAGAPAWAQAQPEVPLTVDAGHVAATESYRAFAAGNFAQAAATARDAVRLSPRNKDYRRLLVSSLLQSGDLAGAEAAVAEATVAGVEAGAFDVELAYAAMRAGDDTKAFEAFDRAAAASTLPGTALRDAAYAAQRLGRDVRAVDYFKRSLDEEVALKTDPALRFQTRRAVSDVDRRGGAIASLTYRGAVPGLGVVPGGEGDNLQAGIEAYWRPWGYRNARPVEVFARAFETIHSEGEGATGSDTRQVALGVRHKPFTAINLVGSISRVFAPSDGRDDWLAQIGYSGGNGTDLRVDTDSWWTTRVSAEAGRYLREKRTYALANAEAGKSYRFGGPEGKWVVFPHVAVAADYDSLATRRSALGAGPGVLARFWFREDTYSAPRSYLDILLQYRWRLAGAERAEGIFLSATLSF